MLEHTRTGQIVGFLLKNWMPMSVDRFLASTTGGIAGLEYAAENLLRYNPKILRAVFNGGPAVDSVERLCRSFSDQDVKKIYLPRWFFADFLVELTPSCEPISLTAIQVARPDKDNGVGVSLSIYANKIRKDLVTEPKNNKKFWEELRYAFAKVGVEEFWNRITGAIKPSWGMLDNGRSGRLYLAEANFHYCFIREGVLLPEDIDQTDLTRVEQFLESNGVSSKEMVKMGITKEYIARAVSKLGESNSSPAALLESEKSEAKSVFAAQNI